MAHDRKQSDLGFRFMALGFRIRDWLRPPVKILQEAGMQSGMSILDFGCGPGGFTLAAARLVGPEGHVFAVDINPLALKMVEQGALEQGLKNIETVLGDIAENVPKDCLDMALIYDVLHGLAHPRATMMKMFWLLKPEGVLSISDHHMKEEKLLALAAGCDFVRLPAKSKWTLQFRKTAEEGVVG